MLAPAYSATISPRKVVVYARRSKLKHQNSTTRFGTTNKVKGTLSAVSIRKMKKAVEMLEAIADEKSSYNEKKLSFWKWKLNFVTLTLPAPQGGISDAEFRRFFLNHFLILVKRKYHPKGYVWRLESQANDNIHVHLIFDKWIDKDELRRLWNHVLSKAHFINDFEIKHGHRDPNSTDVHSTAGINNVVNYLGKYLTKTDGKVAWLKENISKLEFRPMMKDEVRNHLMTPFKLRQYRKIEGKLWGCSENLMGKKGITGNWDEGDETNLINAEKTGLVGGYIGSHFKIYYQKRFPISNFLLPYYKLRLQEYIATLRSGPSNLFPIES